MTDFYLKNSINNAQEMATCKNGHLLSEMLERALIGQGSTEPLVLEPTVVHPSLSLDLAVEWGRSELDYSADYRFGQRRKLLLT